MKLVRDKDGKVTLEVDIEINLNNDGVIDNVVKQFPEAKGLINWGKHLFSVYDVPAVIDRTEKGIRYQTQSWIDLED